jgi:hypothetical protein
MYMDESSLWMKKDELLNVGNKHYFCKKNKQKNRVKQNFVGFFQNNSTNKMFKSQFKTILHISLI